MKTCSEPGCNNPQFGGGFCKFHAFRRRMYGGDLYQKKKKQKDPELFAPPKAIKKESPKRKIENKRYLQRLSEKWEEDVKEGKNVCIFCGQVIHKREANHHIRGRGSYMLEEEFWSWAHHNCHNNFHHLDMEHLLELWWDGYLSRVKLLDEITYLKDKRREQKYREDLFGE